MNTDPPAMRADAKRNYVRLIEAAESIFSMQGAFTSLDAIARQAGVGIGTLYRHFPSRKALLEAVYADEIADLAVKSQTLLKAAAPDKALNAWLQATVEYATKNNGFSNLISLMNDDKDSPLIAAGADLLRRAQKAGTLRGDVTISDLLQLVAGIVSDTNTPHNAKRMNTMLSVIMAGLKKK